MRLKTGPDAAEYETERGEGSAGPAFGQYDHGGAAALGRARQPKRRAQRERSRMAVNIEDQIDHDQAETTRAQNHLGRQKHRFDSRLHRRVRCAWRAQIQRPVIRPNRAHAQPHRSRPRESSRGQRPPRRCCADRRPRPNRSTPRPRRAWVAIAAKEAASEVRPNPRRPTISLTRPRTMPPSKMASSAAIPELRRRSLRVSSRPRKTPENSAICRSVKSAKRRGCGKTARQFRSRRWEKRP